MRILVTGATGFLGSRLREALLAAGHEVVAVARRPGPAHARCRWIALDFAGRPDWRPALAGVQVVVNTVGIFRERGAQTFEALHVRAPIALFEACAAAGVARIVQVSALGADAQAETAYALSKAQADAAVLALGGPAGSGRPDVSVVQPSLVFGAEGESARSFLTWASLPLLPLPAGGRQRVQPIHVDDAVAALCALLLRPAGRVADPWRGRRLALVGPAPLSLAEYLLALRASLGLSHGPAGAGDGAGSPTRRSSRRGGRAWLLPVPGRLVGWAALLLGRWPGSLLDPDAWRMLQRGNTAPARDTEALLGQPPRPAVAFVGAGERAALAQQAALGWTRPLLRLALATVWLGTAFVSLFAFPIADSLELLARAGVPDLLQRPALVGAALLDAAFGVLTLAPLAPRAARALWALQGLLIVGYSAVIALRLPEFWLHPYAPMLKNLPMLAALVLLAATERRA